MAMGAIAVLAAMSILGVGVLGTAGMMSGTAPAGMTGGGMMSGGGMGGMHGGGMMGGGGMGGCDMDQMQNHAMDCDMPMDPGQCPCCGDGDGT